MVFKDYYKILELETSRVSLEEIKVAYRNAAKKYHPDVNVGDYLAEEKIKDINEAYRVLSAPSSKRKYDKIWNTHNINKVPKIFNIRKGDSSILNIFLGNKEKNESKADSSNNKAIKGENIETEITATIQETFFGTDKKISLKNIEGKTKTFDVKIPEGIANGEKIRLIGQGKSGKNGGKNGDLIIKIKISDDDIFKIKGYDIYTDLYLSPWEAVLGSKVDIKSLEGETKIYIPRGIQSGEVIRIPQKGYKNKNGTRGDLVVEVKIMVPKKVSEEERKIFEKLNKISSFNPRNEK